MVEHLSPNPILQRPQSHTRVMGYDYACFMVLTPGAVHNFPNAVGVSDFCPPMHNEYNVTGNKIQIKKRDYRSGHVLIFID